MKPRILVIEDDPAVADSLRDLLAGEGYEVVTAGKAEQGLQELGRGEFDTVVTDLYLPGIDGLELTRRLHERSPLLPIILITGHHKTETAIEATKRGAYEYVIKGTDVQWITELLDHVANAVACKALCAGQIEPGSSRSIADTLVGTSAAMQEVYKKIGKLAATAGPVLIRGEAGTGKARVARALHQHSDRAGEKYFAVPCAAIPEQLLQRELFGAESDPLRDVPTQRIGRFEQAGRGTVFLDEIGGLGWGSQKRLLQLLEDKTITRLGGTRPIAVAARVLMSTSRDLDQAVRSGQFREELYVRLKEAQIQLPALRDRLEDIPELLRHVLQRQTPAGQTPPAIDPGAIEAIRQHDWPGNMRELENVVAKALRTAQGNLLTGADIRLALAAGKPAPRAEDRSLASYVTNLLDRAERGELSDIQRCAIEGIERELYAQIIRRTKGNQSEAARLLGVSRPTVREKLQQYGLYPGGDAEPR